MKDYKYIREHPEEYAEEYKEVDAEVRKLIAELEWNVPEGDIFLLVDRCFHLQLIRSGKETLPDRCGNCPLLECHMMPSGQVTTSCSENVKWFIGDLFFGWNVTSRPHWCPLNEYIQTEMEDEHG